MTTYNALWHTREIGPELSVNECINYSSSTIRQDTLILYAEPQNERGHLGL